MYVDYNPEQKALRAELRAYFAKLVPPDLRQQLHGLETSPLHKKLVRQMGRDGWLGVGWPKFVSDRLPHSPLARTLTRSQSGT